MYETTLNYSDALATSDPFAHDRLRLDALRGTHIDMYQDIPPIAESRQGHIRDIFEGAPDLPGLGELLRYHRYGGSDRDRAAASGWLSKLLGNPPMPSRIAITHGTQDAMIMLLSHYLAEGGGTLLTEELTYPSIKSIARLMRVPIKGIAMDEHGIRPDVLEKVAQSEKGPLCLYTMPNIHNPTTITTSSERRTEIVALARKYGITILEDDAFGHFSDAFIPPYCTLAPEITWHLFTIAKALSIQLRIAFVTGPSETEVQRVFGPTRRMTHWMATPLSAELTTSLLERGIGEQLLKGVRDEIAARQFLVETYLHELDVKTQPHSPHVWLKLPRSWERDAFVNTARDAGVLVMPSDPCSTHPNSVPEAVRICLGVPTIEQVRKGLETISTLAKR